MPPIQHFHKIHPMILAATASITIFSMLGNASGTGRTQAASLEQAEPAQPPAGHHTSLAVADNPAMTGSKGIGGQTCRICGTIESVSTVQQKGYRGGSNAIAGGIPHNLIGKGHGETLLTIIDAGGAAYTGHAIEQGMKPAPAYVVRVRMGDGTSRMIALSALPPYAVGDHVRVVSGRATSA